MAAAKKGDELERLKRSGLWTEYENLRDSFEDTLDLNVSVRIALEQMMPKVDEWEAAHPEELNGGDTASVDPVVADTGKVKTATDNSKNQSRDTRIVNIIMWVAENLGKKKHSSAPSTAAKAMLESYKERPDDFWDKIFIKLIPNRANLGDEQPVDVGSVRLIDATNKLLEISSALETDE